MPIKTSTEDELSHCDEVDVNKNIPQRLFFKLLWWCLISNKCSMNDQNTSIKHKIINIAKNGHETIANIKNQLIKHMNH